VQSTRKQVLVPSDLVVPTAQRVAGGVAEPGRQRGLLNYEEAALYLSTAPRHVRKLWQSRCSAAVKVGRCVRFQVAALDVFIAANRVPPTR
jgi:excisionase family DNA binding protein